MMKKEMDALKHQVAQVALSYVKPNMILGIGTGSTVDCFISALAQSSLPLQAVVSSSRATTVRLRAHGIAVMDLNAVTPPLPLYVDGADEVDPLGNLIKGGGAAMTAEKIVAAAADQFLCLIDASKQVKKLGQRAPVPVEVLPMARSFVARAIVALNGRPEWREGVYTDHGNVILDVYHWNLDAPYALSKTLNTIPGVVEHGLFVEYKPNRVLCAHQDGTVSLWQRPCA